MSDKRTVATDALATLGTIIDATQKRDAIHLAVEPVVAGQDMNPGDRISVIDGVAWTDYDGAIGIVDPFLAEAVIAGQRFWCVLLPRTINSLRHVWTHPALPDEVEADEADSETPASIKKLRQEASEKWLREFCDGADCPSYEYVIELLDKGTLPSTDHECYKNGGEYSEDHFLFRGRDAHEIIPAEFWAHAEVVLDRKLPHRHEYFSCSC